MQDGDEYDILASQCTTVNATPCAYNRSLAGELIAACSGFAAHLSTRFSPYSQAAMLPAGAIAADTWPASAACAASKAAACKWQRKQAASAAASSRSANLPACPTTQHQPYQAGTIVHTCDASACLLWGQVLIRLCCCCRLDGCSEDGVSHQLRRHGELCDRGTPCQPPFPAAGDQRTIDVILFLARRGACRG